MADLIFGFSETSQPAGRHARQARYPRSRLRDRNDSRRPRPTTYERYADGGHEAIYSTSRAFNGSQSAYTLNASTGSTTRDHFAFAGQAAQRRYISYRVYPINQDGVYKGDRQTANLGNGGDNRLYDSPPNFGRDWYIFTNNCSEFVSHGNVGYADDAWSRVEQWITISDPGLANGVYEYWVNLTLQRTTGPYATNSGCMGGAQIDSWISPNNVNRRNGPGEYWVDLLYVDDTRQRVELGDSPAWEDCTDRVIQIPRDQWTDTAITIEVNSGQFSPGTYWIFVVDDDNNPSPGIEVTLE
jgi:hypothetical protein